MRGGLRLAERGVIPRLLSNVFRRGKKIAKDTDGETTVDVSLSYYEIYNDKVFDLLEPPEKRTPSGLPLREKDAKTIVVGLSERACGDLKDFERLYIEANNNRVTAATKLNAHSSRSHAILRVKVTQTTGDRVRESTASAIDLAGSEDNRRTDNGKERLVESAAINKSLFVLSQCVDAISRGEKRIPYRESKMTRILSLGQNNGITVMILNLAPLRSYHLDTLSSLNVSSRAKRIEVREIENEIIYKQPPRPTASGTSLARQPLRPLANAHNVANRAVVSKPGEQPEKLEKPAKAFSVYSDRSKPSSQRPATTVLVSTSQIRRSNSNKRPSDSSDPRPTKIMRPTPSGLARGPASHQPTMSAEQIEAIIERKVAEALAARSQPEAAAPEPQQPAQAEITEAVQRRLDALERRIEDGRQDDSRSDGLRLLLLARQHKETGDDEAALHYYEKALPFFPTQTKLVTKIERLRAKLAAGKDTSLGSGSSLALSREDESRVKSAPKLKHTRRDDDDYHAEEADVDDESFHEKPRAKTSRNKAKAASMEDDGELTPRKQQLLDIVNSRDVAQIKGLAGFGAKKAQDLVKYLDVNAEHVEGGKIETLLQLRSVPGMGSRTLERAYGGLVV